jgi:hypothetical protein
LHFPGVLLHSCIDLLVRLADRAGAEAAGETAGRDEAARGRREWFRRSAIRHLGRIANRTPGIRGRRKCRTFEQTRAEWWS